jgi:hypothetical protein
VSNGAAVASPTRGNPGRSPDLSPWFDTPEIDPPSMLYMGANPCWTPARERHVFNPNPTAQAAGATARPVPGSPLGLAKGAERCRECGGRLIAGDVDDPLGDSELVVNVCGACMRSAGQHANRQVGAKGDPDFDRPGRMAAKMGGKVDPKLNAYARPFESVDSIVKTTQPNGPARHRPRGSAKPAPANAPAVAGPAAGRPGKLVTGRGAHHSAEHYAS